MPKNNKPFQHINITQQMIDRGIYYTSKEYILSLYHKLVWEDKSIHLTTASHVPEHLTILSCNVLLFCIDWQSGRAISFEVFKTLIIAYFVIAVLNLLITEFYLRLSWLKHQIVVSDQISKINKICMH